MNLGFINLHKIIAILFACPTSCWLIESALKQRAIFILHNAATAMSKNNSDLLLIIKAACRLCPNWEITQTTLNIWELLTCDSSFYFSLLSILLYTNFISAPPTLFCILISKANSNEVITDLNWRGKKSYILVKCTGKIR